MDEDEWFEPEQCSDCGKYFHPDDLDGGVWPRCADIDGINDHMDD